MSIFLSIFLVIFSYKTVLLRFIQLFCIFAALSSLDWQADFQSDSETEQVVPRQSQPSREMWR